MDVQSQIVAKRAAANRARQLADRLSGDYKIHALVAPLWRLKLGPRWAVPLQNSSGACFQQVVEFSFATEG